MSAFRWLLVIFIFTVNIGCNETKKNKPQVRVFADISFQPVIEQQYNVFNTLFSKQQKTLLTYATESECFEALAIDSADMIITSRELSQNEKDYLKSVSDIVPKSRLLAFDAIALITSKKTTDTLLSLEDIKQLLTGKSKKYGFVAVEGSQASSTLMHLVRVLNIDINKLSPKIIGIENPKNIIKFVIEKPSAIGILGVLSVGQMDIPQVQSFNNPSFHVLSVLNQKNKTYVKPYQANLTKRLYPLIRPIFFAAKEITSGPGLRFGRFMSNEQGQLIFKRSYCMPANMNFEIREINIK